MKTTTNSPLQFSNPELLRIDFKANINFDMKDPDNDEVAFDNSIGTKIERLGKNTAYVYVKINIESDNGPFLSEMEIRSRFIWDDRLSEDEALFLLKNNAVALLVSYSRPIISFVTSQTAFPTYHMPFMDLREND